MKYFAENNGLSVLSRDKKIALTMFLAMITLGYISGILMALHRSGMEPQRVAGYYLGDESRLIFPKTYGSLLEITHFHLFSMSIIFLAITHLFLICKLSSRLKILLLFLSFTGLMADMASPWLILYEDAAWAWLMVVSLPFLSLSLFIMVALILRELWFMKPATEEASIG